MSDVYARAYALLAAASMLPEAQAAKLEQHTSHSKPDSGDGPAGDGYGLHDAIANRIRRGERKGPASLLIAVEWGEMEIRAVQYSRRPKLDLTTREGRLTLGADPREANVVAEVYDLPISTVYRWRNQARKLGLFLDAA